jgi:hypothetical protein
MYVRRFGDEGFLLRLAGQLELALSATLVEAKASADPRGPALSTAAHQTYAGGRYRFQAVRSHLIKSTGRY